MRVNPEGPGSGLDFCGGWGTGCQYLSRARLQGSPQTWPLDSPQRPGFVLS